MSNKTYFYHINSTCNLNEAADFIEFILHVHYILESRRVASSRRFKLGRSVWLCENQKRQQQFRH
jgi:hypothetical protein